VLASGASPIHAQNSIAVTQMSTQAGNKAEQAAVCGEKVVQLNEQLHPLHTKRNALWTERKSIGASGGEAAKNKLARIAGELLQVTKQIDGLTGQIDSEKRRCEGRASTTPSSAAASAQAQQKPDSALQSQPNTKTKKKSNHR